MALQPNPDLIMRDLAEFQEMILLAHSTFYYMKVKVFFYVLFFSITGKYGLLQAAQPPVTFLFKALQMNFWMGGS